MARHGVLQRHGGRGHAAGQTAAGAAACENIVVFGNNYFVLSSYPISPSLVLLSTLSMLDRREEQPEPAILLANCPGV